MGKTFTAVATLIGTIIGAGILGIPYVVMRSGFGVGLLVMLLVGAIALVITFYLGEVVLRTKGNLHLSGYAKKYLGKKAEKIMFLAFSFGIFSALTAYLVGEGESISTLFFQSSSFSLYFGIVFWLLLSAMTYYGIKALKEGEQMGLIVVLVLIFLIVLIFWNKVDASNLTYNNFQFFFVPFGVILFAFLGFSVMPEIERILGKERKLMGRTIWISYLATFVIYAVFTAVVLGSQGQATPQIATITLGKIFILLGMFVMFTSYLALTIAFVDMLHFDFKKTRKVSWLYTVLISLVIFIALNLVKEAVFTKILGIGGVVAGGVVGTLILLIAGKARKFGDRKPEYSVPYSRILIGIIIFILTVGAVLEIISVF